MSAALTTAERRALEAVVRPFALMAGEHFSPELIAVVGLVARLNGLRHCDQCGNLFDGLVTQDECQHCAEDRRQGEAMEARGDF